METNIETNANEVFLKFKDFNLKEMRRSTKSALRKGASVLARNTKKILKRSLKKSTHRSEKYSDRLIDAVRYSVDKKGEFAKVHIMGTRKSTSGTFRLRFFELGTKIRYSKKTRKKYGAISALNFFSSARRSSHSDVYDAIDEQLIKTIEKINKQKFDD